MIAQVVTPETIPLTAWEQAVIIVLFVVLLSSMAAGAFALLRYVIKQFQAQNGLFQDYIAARDADWQRFFTTLHTGDKVIIERLVESVNCLTVEVRGSRDDLREHDAKVDARIRESEKAVIAKSKTVPRKPQ